MGSIWDLFQKIFGVNVSIPSPREAGLKGVVYETLHPHTTNLYTQNYYDHLGIFVWILGLSLMVHFAWAIISGVINNDIVPKLKRWFLTAFFYIGGIGFVPPFLTGLQNVMSLVGQAIFKLMLGSNDPDKALAIFSHLTGIKAIDFVLSIVQGLFVILLWGEIKLIPIMMALSVICLIIAATVVWLDNYGDSWLRLSLNICVYGVAGYFILLSVFGLIAGFGALVFNNDPVGRGFATTIAIIVAAFVMLNLLKALGGQIKAVVSGTMKGVKAVGSRVRHPLGGSSRGGSDRQAGRSAETHKRHSQRSTSETGDDRQTANNRRQPNHPRTDQETAEQRRHRISRRRAAEHSRNRSETARSDSQRPQQRDSQPTTTDRDGTRGRQSTPNRRQPDQNNGTAQTRTSEGTTIRPVERSQTEPRSVTHTTNQSRRERRREGKRDRA